MQKIKHEPKEYFNNGSILRFTEPYTNLHSEAMDKGEIFTRLSKGGVEHSVILKDSYGTIREKTT